MEDPRIISALFIFLKMAYYNVLINTDDEDLEENERKEANNATEQKTKRTRTTTKTTKDSSQK